MEPSDRASQRCSLNGTFHLIGRRFVNTIDSIDTEIPRIQQHYRPNEANSKFIELNSFAIALLFNYEFPNTKEEEIRLSGSDYVS